MFLVVVLFPCCCCCSCCCCCCCCFRCRCIPWLLWYVSLFLCWILVKLLDRGWMLDAFSWSCYFNFIQFPVFIFLEAKNKLTVKLTVKKTTSPRRRHTARKLMRIHVPKCCQREKQLSDRKTTGLSQWKEPCKFKSIWQDSRRFFHEAKVLGRLGKPFVHLPQWLDQLDEARAFLGSTFGLC